MSAEVRENNFTEGAILVPLLKFALPILFALILQSMYGAVDLLIVGKFATAAVVSQNYGAGKYARAYRTLYTAIGLSFLAGLFMFYISFFHGDVLAGLFSKQQEVVLAGAEYLKSYAIDCLLTAFLFSFIGFYNGIGQTKFVMIQGICGAFLMRIPLSFLFSRMMPISLFRIGLATPCSTILQIMLCLGYFWYVRKYIFKE